MTHSTSTSKKHSRRTVPQRKAASVGGVPASKLTGSGRKGR